jgi:hypothetical protein
VALAGIFNDAAHDENTRVVLWHRAGSGGTTMLMHCDFIYAGASIKCQMPFTTLLSFRGFAFSRWDEVAETWKKGSIDPAIAQF